MGLTRFPHGILSMGTPVPGLLTGGGAGNVYYVCKDTTAAWYAKWLDNHNIVYDDGSTSCHTTIQAAHDAATTNRGDVIILVPSSSDYDLAETVTISKDRLTIACPEAIIPGGTTPNFVRIHNAGDFAAFTITATAAVTIAGLFFRETTSSGDDYPIIDIDNAANSQVWGINLLYNWFGAATGASGHATKGIVNFAETGGAHNIIGNTFGIYNPTSTKTTAALLRFATQVLLCTIRDNFFHTGSTAQTVTAAIAMEGSSYDNKIIGNYFCESNISGASVLTTAISAGNDIVADNRVVCTAANAASMMAGGTANKTFSRNFGSNAGGLDAEVLV